MKINKKKQTALIPLAIRRIGSTGNLSGKDVTLEQKVTLNTQAIEVFTEACNAGRSFQDSLGAVLMTGLMWGVELTQEKASE